MLGQLELVASVPPPEFVTILGWADDARRGRIGVRANADNGPDATPAPVPGPRASASAAPSTCSSATSCPSRAADDPGAHPRGRGRCPGRARSSSSAPADFMDILEAMDGLPVTVAAGPAAARVPPESSRSSSPATPAVKRLEGELFSVARTWQEQNPMLGTRGCSVSDPQGGSLQDAGASVVEAASERKRRRGHPHVEMMIPHRGPAPSWPSRPPLGSRSRSPTCRPTGQQVDVKIGTMIETPRW